MPEPLYWLFIGAGAGFGFGMAQIFLGLVAALLEYYFGFSLDIEE